MLKYSEQTVLARRKNLLNLTKLLQRSRWFPMPALLVVALIFASTVAIARDERAPAPGTYQYFYVLAESFLQTANSFNLSTPYCSSAAKTYDINFLQGQIDGIDNLRSEIAESDPEGSSNPGEFEFWTKKALENTRKARALLRMKLAEATASQVEDCTSGGSSTPPRSSPPPRSGRSTVGDGSGDGFYSPGFSIKEISEPIIPKKFCSEQAKYEYIARAESILKTAEENLAAARRYENSLESMKNGRKKKRLKNAAIDQSTKHRRFRDKVKRAIETLRSMEVEECSELEISNELLILGKIPFRFDQFDGTDDGGTSGESSNPDTGKNNPRSGYDDGEPDGTLGPQIRFRDPFPMDLDIGQDSGDDSSGSPDREDRTRGADSDIEYGYPNDRLQPRVRYRYSPGADDGSGSDSGGGSSGSPGRNDRTRGADSDIEYGYPNDRLQPRVRYRYSPQADDGSGPGSRRGSSGSPDRDDASDGETGYPVRLYPRPVHGGGMTTVDPPSDPTLLDGSDLEEPIESVIPQLSDPTRTSYPRGGDRSGTGDQGRGQAVSLPDHYCSEEERGAAIKRAKAALKAAKKNAEAANDRYDYLVYGAGAEEPGADEAAQAAKDDIRKWENAEYEAKANLKAAEAIKVVECDPSGNPLQQSAVPGRLPYNDNAAPSSSDEPASGAGGEAPRGGTSESRTGEPQGSPGRTAPGESSGRPSRTGVYYPAVGEYGENNDAGSSETSGSRPAQSERRVDPFEQYSGDTETSFRGGGELMRAFTDSDGVGWDYCSGKCIMKTESKKRADGTTDKVLRVSRGTCDKDCSCVVFNTSGPKLVNELEVTGKKGYLNIGPNGKSKDYSVRCVE